MLTNASNQDATASVTEPVSHTFEKVGDLVVVRSDGEEIEWDDYVEESTSGALLLGFSNENGWGSGSDEAYMAAPGVVVEAHACEDIASQKLHRSVGDAAALSLDLLDNNEMTVALAAVVYGPLFEGNTALWCPLLPMSPFEVSPYAEGTNGEEMPGLHWGGCTEATEEVRAAFRPAAPRPASIR